MNEKLIMLLGKINERIFIDVDTKNYFKIDTHKKNLIILNVFKKTREIITQNLIIENDDLKKYFNLLLNKNIDIENFQNSAVLLDIINNYDSIIETLNVATRPKVKFKKK